MLTVSDATKTWTFRYRAHNRMPRPAIVLLPAEYGPQQSSPSAAARDLAARPWCPRPGEREALGQPPRPRPVRRGLSRRDGAPDAAALLGLQGPDLRPRAHAGDREGGASLDPLRHGPHLRAGGKHGRPGDLAPARPVPPGPRRGSRDGLGHQLPSPLRRLRADRRGREGCRPSPASRSAARPARIRPATSCAARRTGSTRSRARASRYSCGGAWPTRSSSTRLTNRRHFYEQLKKKRPKGPVKAVAGHWLHSQLMRTQMPEALRFLGLLP